VSNKLRIIPLGGAGEIGKNMTAIQYGEAIVAIDAGLMFPESDMPGIDLVIPDFGYLVENAAKVRAILITHGHEDHIGALPYVLRRVNAPIYATPLTRGLIEVKLEEHRLLERASLVTVRPGDSVDIGPFQVEFFRVCHSIPDGVGIALQTPVGLVVHSGDFKFDNSPVDGQLTDYAKLTELRQRGVLVLLADSTNAERSGYTPSEHVVGETFDRIFAWAPGRIIVATFASNISRVQQVIDTAARYGRHVGFAGRSMADNVKIALDLGYLKAPDGTLKQLDELARLSHARVVIVCTGSQGEPTSVLVRMANREHRQVVLEAGDTVIISATPIPGNEELVHRTINNLFRLGVDVYYDKLMAVHVSGHGSQEDHRLLINLLRPKFFIPIHGEYRHLVLHARIAEETGLPRQNVFVVENGHIVEFDDSRGAVVGRVPGGYVFVDGLGIGDVGEVVLRDRHHLAQDGFLVAVVVVDEKSGELVEGPDLITRGFIYLRDADALLDEAKARVVSAMRKQGRATDLHPTIKDTLSQFLYEKTKRRPMILPVVMEV